MPVRKADSRSGIRLSSPGMHRAMIPDTVISADTSSSETLIYHMIIFQFMSLSFEVAKLFRQETFINTKMFIFALILSISKAV